MPLVLDLLRHGEAAASSPDGDAGRPLTPRGAAAIERLARSLAAAGAHWDRAFSSPLLRARQTAALVLGDHAAPRGPEILEGLAPDAEPAELVAALQALGADSGRILLVGHMPLLGSLVAHLSDGGALAMQPGELVRVEFAGPLARGGGRRVIAAPGRDPA